MLTPPTKPLALRSTLREQRGAVLTPEQQSAVLHGTSQLYLALRGEVDAQLQKFEAYALETCLHVPAGLLVATVSGGAGGRCACMRPRSCGRPGAPDLGCNDGSLSWRTAG